MFGDGTPEQKEEKLKQLDEEIVEMEEKVKIATEAIEKFESSALANVEKFYAQKTSDITDVLITHVVMSIDQCKKSKASWVNVRQACQSM